MTSDKPTQAISGLIDLVSERVGGKVLSVSDEFFAGKENLLKASRPIFIPDKYTDRGKWMDGWETRRKRTPGHDWCIIKLGLPGRVKTVDIDTSHFLGNNPTHVSIEVCSAAANVSIGRLLRTTWTEILPKSPTNPGTQNLFSVESDGRWTHLRLNIFPDGGVARLRVYGEALPDWNKIRKNQLIDLAAVTNGGLVVASSDMFFGSRENLIMPDRAKNMGDGWETKRRRGPGYDWAIVRLGHRGIIKRIEVDTTHFKGNYPDMCSIDLLDDRSTTNQLQWENLVWNEILPKVKLKAHSRHFFQKELKQSRVATHVRLNIYPDGGISRLRVWGVIA